MQPRRACTPIKVNMVVKRGVNDHEVVPMARHFRGTGHILRFIEFMDVGSTNGWRLDDVVSASEIVARVDDAFGLEPLDPQYRGEVARRWRYRDGSGEIGVISSVSAPFCRTCTRARLSAEGKVYTCLFATSGNRSAPSPARRRERRVHRGSQSAPCGPGARTATPKSVLRPASP